MCFRFIFIKRYTSYTVPKNKNTGFKMIKMHLVAPQNHMWKISENPIKIIKAILYQNIYTPTY